MFERTMKRGAGLLFCLALLFFAVTVIQFVAWLFQLVFPSEAILPNRLRFLLGITWLYSLSTAGLFLATAIIVNRLDRWLVQTGRQP